MLYGTERANERANERVDCNHIHLCPWEPVRLKQQAHPGKFRIRSKPGGQKVVCHLSKTTTVIASLTHTHTSRRWHTSQPSNATSRHVPTNESMRERQKVKSFLTSSTSFEIFRPNTNYTFAHSSFLFFFFSSCHISQRKGSTAHGTP